MTEDDSKRLTALDCAIRIAETGGALTSDEIVTIATAFYKFLNPSKAGIWEGKRTRRKARG